VDAGLVAHHGERGEDRAADDVAEDDDQDRLREPEAEHDAERAGEPCDRRDVRAAPDPELLPARGVPVGFGNLLNRVGVQPGFAPRDVLCHFSLLSLRSGNLARARGTGSAPPAGPRATNRIRWSRPPDAAARAKPCGAAVPLFRPAWP